MDVNIKSVMQLYSFIIATVELRYPNKTAAIGMIKSGYVHSVNLSQNTIALNILIMNFLSLIQHFICRMGRMNWMRKL